MRFKEFLKEDNQREVTNKLQMLKHEFDQIKQDCQPYLQQNKSPIFRTPMFRGMDPVRSLIQTASDVIKKQVRLKDRRTTDIPDSVSSTMNDWMTKEFGEPFRHALFVSGNENMANNYGRIYLVFPIGNFTFLYHDQFKDIYSTFSHFKWADGKAGHSEPTAPTAAAANKMVRDRNMKYDEGFHKRFIEYISSVNRGTWKQDSIVQAIDSKHEIAIRTKEYYAVNYGAIRMVTTYTDLESIEEVEKELLG